MTIGGKNPGRGEGFDREIVGRISVGAGPGQGQPRPETEDCNRHGYYIFCRVHGRLHLTLTLSPLDLFFPFFGLSYPPPEPCGGLFSNPDNQVGAVLPL